MVPVFGAFDSLGLGFPLWDVGSILATLNAPLLSAAAAGRPFAVKITALETLRLDEFPNLIWVMVHTDQGLTGVGETFYGARAVEAHIHETLAPLLLGAEPLRLEYLNGLMTSLPLAQSSTGVEYRAASAVDIAQTLNRLLVESGASGVPSATGEPTQRVQIMSDARTNSILLRSENPVRLARALERMRSIRRRCRVMRCDPVKISRLRTIFAARSPSW